MAQPPANPYATTTPTPVRPAPDAAAEGPGTAHSIRSTRVNAVVTDITIRCWRCGKMLAIQASRPWAIRCVRCHGLNLGDEANPATLSER